MSGEPEGSEIEWAQQARASVHQAAGLLLRPSGATLDAGRPHLEEAVRFLKALEKRARSGASGRHPGLAAEVNELRREVGRIGTLVEHAAALYMSQARLLYAATGGYSATGDPVPPPAPRTVSIRG